MENIQFSKNIDASIQVIKAIEDGYGILLVEMPTPAFLAKTSQLSLGISDLSDPGCIEEVSPSGARIISPVSAPKMGYKLRLILDYSLIKQFYFCAKIKVRRLLYR